MMPVGATEGGSRLNHQNLQRLEANPYVHSMGGVSNSYGRLPAINRKKAEVTGKPTSHDPFGYF